MVAPVVFSSAFKVAFVTTWKVACGELRHCFMRCTNPQLSQLVAKCEQILCMTSCEFKERAREVKICCQSRPALYYSQQQVDPCEELETSAKLRVLVSNISSPRLKRRYTRFFFFVYFAAFRTARSHSFFFAVHVGVLHVFKEIQLKVISIKSHGKSLLFGYYKLGFRCLELNLFFFSLLRFERL